MDIINMLYEYAFNVLRKHKIMFVFSVSLYWDVVGNLFFLLEYWDPFITRIQYYCLQPGNARKKGVISEGMDHVLFSPNIEVQEPESLNESLLPTMKSTTRAPYTNMD